MSDYLSIKVVISIIQCPLELRKEFIQQSTIKDVFINMINGYSYEHILSNNNEPSIDSNKKGCIYEAVVNICIFTKQSPIKFSKFTLDNFNDCPVLSVCENFKEFFNPSIYNSNGPSDSTLIDERGHFTPGSIKYRDNVVPKDIELNQLAPTLKEQYGEDYKLFAIVKDKQHLLDHNHRSDNNIHKKVFDKVVNDNLLFDEKDVKGWFKSLQLKFSGMKYQDAIEKCNKEYLNTERQCLKLRLHQKLFELAFLRNYHAGKLKHLLNHKMRSGKSIELLWICNILLTRCSMTKILIMTSVPATINSFIKALDGFIEFKHIQYKNQDEFLDIDPSFKGIGFCSVQYLKMGNDELKKKKQNKLSELNFDCLIFDESHHGSSNKNTKDTIISKSDIKKLIHSKLVIFASGTGDKTKHYYDIPSQCVYDWDIIDEGCMKQIGLDEIDESKKFMILRHGEDFIQSLADDTLDRDYSKYPSQVLIQPTIVEQMIKMIKDHNAEYGTNFGFDFASILALDEYKSKSKKKTYKNKFQICKTDAGRKMLKKILSMIISDNPMDNTVMKEIEETQSAYESKQSTEQDCGMYLMYLPIHNRNGSISKIQETLYLFLQEHSLWSQFNIEYTNGSSRSIHTNDLNDFINKGMKKTKDNSKKGCILLLGNQGTLGIDYPDCLGTISLDNGHNIDSQKQRWARAGMDSEGKKIFINVDMNIQRTYLMLDNKVREYKKSHPDTTKTYQEILKFYYDQKIFIFNPSKINFGASEVTTINYFEKIANEIRSIIDIDLLSDQIECGDSLQEYIKNIKEQYISTGDDNLLNGLQQNCPHVGQKKIEGNSVINDNYNKKPDKQVEELKKIFEINKTKHIAQKIIKIVAIIHRISCGKIKTLKDVCDHKDWKHLIIYILNNKFDFKIYKYYNQHSIIEIMTNIIDNNKAIFEQIKEKYLHADSTEFRKRVEQDFIPSKVERKKNAEIPTPINLVDDMLNSMSNDYFSQINPTLEPCCGKGNFVLGIFEKFYYNLTHILDKAKRCKVIIEKCLYFGDITPLNVVITKALIMTIAEKYCGVKQQYKINTFVGDTLKAPIEDIFNGMKFKCVISNFPYNDKSGNKGRGHMLWDKFVERTLDKWLEKDAHFLTVHPSTWRQLDNKLFKKLTSKQIIYLEIHNVLDGQKTFGASTRYDWYLLKNTPKYKNTQIKDEIGCLNSINLDAWDFLPNKLYDKIKQMLCPDEKNRCQVFRYRSTYPTEKKNLVKKEQSEAYKYPLAYSINAKNIINKRYTNDNTLGHFGKSKFIFSNGRGFYCDKVGEYGLTEWAFCIYDEPDNLDKILKTFKSSEFIAIKEAINLDSFTYNWKVMKLFKKNFYDDI